MHPEDQVRLQPCRSTRRSRGLPRRRASSSSVAVPSLVGCRPRRRERLVPVAELVELLPSVFRPLGGVLHRPAVLERLKEHPPVLHGDRRAASHTHPAGSRPTSTTFSVERHAAGQAITRPRTHARTHTPLASPATTRSDLGPGSSATRRGRQISPRARTHAHTHAASGRAAPAPGDHEISPGAWFIGTVDGELSGSPVSISKVLSRDAP